MFTCKSWFCDVVLSALSSLAIISLGLSCLCTSCWVVFVLVSSSWGHRFVIVAFPGHVHISDERHRGSYMSDPPLADIEDLT